MSLRITWSTVYWLEDAVTEMPGSDTWRAEPKPSVKALANDRVTVTGWVDNIVEAYQSATLFVLKCDDEGDQTNEKEPLLQRSGYGVSVDP